MAELGQEFIDCMVIGAHPDDAELCAAGTIAKLTKEGKSVVLVDCTRGELGTRGTPELREREAQEAAQILGVKERINLGMQDGNIEHSFENIMKLVKVIRRYRPKMILTHPPFERHPDHEHLHLLFRDAIFKSGLKNVKTIENGEYQEVFRTRKIYLFQQAYQFQKNPDFFVDVSDVHEIKMNAIRAFASQVHTPGQFEEEAQTRLASKEFMEELVARSRYYGGLIGVKHAEAFLSLEPVAVTSLSRFLE